MKAKYFLIIAVLATAFFSFAGLTSAQTTTTADLIAQIQAQIQSLTSQLVALQAQQTKTGSAWCHTFNSNLSLGDSGQEVVALFTALKNNGYVPPTNAIGDNFDDYIASAVVEFQEKYVTEILAPYELKHGTGRVGPTTRAKLNSLFGCSAVSSATPVATPTVTSSSGQTSTATPTTISTSATAPVPAETQNLTSTSTSTSASAQTPVATPVEPINPSITLLSPNGGESWHIGETHDITWTQVGFESDTKKVSIYAYGFPTGAISISEATRKAIIQEIPAKDGKYTWAIPSNFSNLENRNRLKIYVLAYDPSGPGAATDFSDNYLSITTASSSSFINSSNLASISNTLGNIARLLKVLKGQ